MDKLPFNDEQLRTLENIRASYDAWLSSSRNLPNGSPWLAWKTIQGKQYLYERRDRKGTGSSLGPKSPETVAMYEEYRNRMELRNQVQEEIKERSTRLAQLGRMYRALGLPMVDMIPGMLLREADIAKILGDGLMVVGTNAIVAYQIEAQVSLTGSIQATDDFDMAWNGFGKTKIAYQTETVTPVFDVLKAVDDTFTKNTERPFQARNRSGFEVELLIAPSAYEKYPKREPLRPIPLPEQEWLLKGNIVNQVACDRSNMACRIVAPDPRWMALHKLWLADKPQRNPLKKKKDQRQGELLLEIIEESMPHYPFDDDFKAQVPEELIRYLP